MTLEQRRIFASKPIERMRRFAALIHWRDLQLERIIFTQDEISEWDLPRSGIITYYVTTDDKFNLQINELDATSPFTHQATIKADRYGIRNIGWCPFTLSDDFDKLKMEAERLRPWLDRGLYKNRSWLREFKREHPEFLLPSRRRHRGYKREL
jgi:hypothetical protein